MATGTRQRGYNAAMSLPVAACGASAQAQRAAREVVESDPIDKLARVGFLAKALVYVLIGVLAIQVAQGDAQQADQQGALQAVADQPLGRVVLWLVVLGFAGCALWRFTEAMWGRRGESDARKRTLKRIGSAGDGLIYLAFMVLAARTATGGSSSGGGASLTAKVLERDGGELLVVLAGAVVIAVAIGLAVIGLRTDFEKHLDTASMGRRMFTAVRRLGQVGYVARGVVFALVGALVIKAAVEHEPGKAAGLDVALRTVADAQGGKVLLLAAAAGLICFGAYAIAEARYRRLETPSPS